MPDITNHKFFVPLTTVVTMLLATASIIWYVAEVKTDLSIQITSIGQELKDHIKYTTAADGVLANKLNK